MRFRLLCIAILIVLAAGLSWAGTAYVNFDDSTPGPLTTSGAVTFEAGRAVISQYCCVSIPCFPTSGVHSFTAEFTVYNMEEILALSQFGFAWEAGFFAAGVLKETSTSFAPLAGTFDYLWFGTPGACVGKGEVVPPGTRKMTVRLVVDAAADTTQTWVAYDTDTAGGSSPGTFHLVSTYPWGGWSDQRALRIQNTGCPSLVIDDVKITAPDILDYTSNDRLYLENGLPDGYTTGGSVTLSDGQAILGAGGSIHVPYFPTSGARTFTAEFTVHNMEEILALSQFGFAWEAGFFAAGVLKETSTSFAPLAGTFDYLWFGNPGACVGKGEVVPPGTRKMTVRLVVDTATNTTQTFVAYDDEVTGGDRPGRFHWTSTYPWGGWSGERVLRIHNSTCPRLVVDNIILSWGNVPPVLSGASAEWRVRDVKTNSAFVAADFSGSVPGLNLRLDRNDDPCDPLWTYRCEVTSTVSQDRAVTLALRIPIDLRGWTWWDDAVTSRTIVSGQRYENIHDYYGSLLRISTYPIAVVSRSGSDSRAICIGIPVDSHRPARFVYDASARELRAEFDFGLSGVPANFPRSADAEVFMFQEQGQWAFRRALERYYEIHSDILTRRAGQGGTHFTKLPMLAASENPEDFFFTWHDFGENVQSWSAANEAIGVQSFVYDEPQTEWRTLRPSYSETVAVDFNDGTAGPLVLSGSVTFANGRAIIAPGASLVVPGFPTAQPENVVMEFTLHNLGDLLTRNDSFDVGWFGRMLCGLKKGQATDGILMACASDSAGNPFDRREIVAGRGTDKVTIKMVASTATLGATHVFVGYDENARSGAVPGNLHLAGQYYWGGWSAEPGYTMRLWNNSAIPVVVDDVIVHRFSGPIPQSNYANWVAQMEEDAAFGVPLAQATVTSGIRNPSGVYNLYLGGIVWSGGYQPFGVNVQPSVPTSGYGDWPSKHGYVSDVYDHILGWGGRGSLMRGVFYDSSEGWVMFNYHQPHWQTTTFPLNFDRTNNNAVGQFTLFSMLEMARDLSTRMRPHNQLLMANDAYHGWNGMPYFDIGGREVSVINAQGNWSPPPDKHYILWRSCSARRPFWTMMNNRYDEQAHIEKHMQRSLFYGFFPTMFHAHDGASPLYWATPGYYNRDRDLWKKYVPMIRELDNAGWEPVPHATVSSPSVRIERFGHASRGNLAFTLHNPAAYAQDVDITLKRYDLGMVGQPDYAVEWTTASAVPVVSSDVWHTILRIALPADSYRVIGVNTSYVTINSKAQYTSSRSVTLRPKATENMTHVSFSNNGANWTAWEPRGEARIWTLTAGDGPKTVHVRFRDGNANVSATTWESIVLDQTAPTGSIAINSGATHTNNQGVVLSVSASDTGSGVRLIRLSNNGSTWSEWEAVSPTRTWMLAGGSGSRTVYAQFRDAAGNISANCTATIGVDLTAPTGNVSINSGATFANSTVVVLSVFASDSGGSGLREMQFGNNSADWTQWEPFASSKVWTLLPGDGLRTVYMRLRDGAGNISAVRSAAITLDTTPPSVPGTPADAGVYTQDTSVVFTWTASGDPGGSGMDGYVCQVGSAPGLGDVWEGSTGNVLSIVITGAAGQRYYCRVRARDRAGNLSGWSPSSDGIAVVEHAGIGIAQAKALPDGSSVGLSAKRVTAVFADGLYISESDRIAGIRIVPEGGVPDGLAPGDLVEIGGVIRTGPDGERWIEAVAALTQE